jgi:CRISPR/Cas system-associated endonuclease Cas1
MRDGTIVPNQGKPEEETRQKARTYYYRHREKILARLRQRYREDDKYREAVRERARKRYHEDEAYREATKRRSRERYYRMRQAQMLIAALRAEHAVGDGAPERSFELDQAD